MASAPPRPRVLQRAPLLRPVLTLVSGAAAAQVVVFAARPLLTRLFSPESFGVLTVVMSVLAVASPLASGGYRSAILLPRSETDRANVFGLAGIAMLGSTVLAALGVWLAPRLGLAAGPTALALVWLPPALLFNEVVTAAGTWHTGRDRFRAVSWARIAQSLTTVAVQLAVGVSVAKASAASAVGLVAGAVAGMGAGAAVSLVWIGVADGRLLRASFSAERFRQLARRYVRFPAFSAPAALLNVAATRVPVFALVASYGEAVTGSYGLAFGTLALPLGLVGGAVGQAFFARAAEARWTGDLPALTRTTARGLWAFASYPSLAVLVAGPTLFAFVFGAEWAEAGRYAQRIAPWMLLASVAPPLTPVFDVLERQQDELKVSALMFVVQAAALVAAGLTLPPRDAVLVAGIAGAALRLVHIAWALRLAGVSGAAAAGDALRALALSAPFAAAVALADAVDAPGALVFGVAVVAGVGALGLTGRRALMTTLRLNRDK